MPGRGAHTAKQRKHFVRAEKALQEAKRIMKKTHGWRALCYDVEAHEVDRTRTLEIGFVWITIHNDNKIEYGRRHLIVEENQGYQNKKYVRGNRGGFLFGKSETRPHKKVIQIIWEQIMTANVIVGHAIEGDIDLIAEAMEKETAKGFRKMAQSKLTIDTQILHKATSGTFNPISLSDLVEKYELGGELVKWGHNGGNDAVFTLAIALHQIDRAKVKVICGHILRRGKYNTDGTVFLDAHNRQSSECWRCRQTTQNICEDGCGRRVCNESECGRGMLGYIIYKEPCTGPIGNSRCHRCGGEPHHKCEGRCGRSLCDEAICGTGYGGLRSCGIACPGQRRGEVSQSITSGWRRKQDEAEHAEMEVCVAAECQNTARSRDAEKDSTAKVTDCHSSGRNDRAMRLTEAYITKEQARRTNLVVAHRHQMREYDGTRDQVEGYTAHGAHGSEARENDRRQRNEERKAAARSASMHGGWREEEERGRRRRIPRQQPVETIRRETRPANLGNRRTAEKWDGAKNRAIRQQRDPRTKPTETARRETRPTNPGSRRTSANWDRAKNREGDRRKRTDCRFFKEGRCNRGDKCDFSHANDNDQNRARRGRTEGKRGWKREHARHSTQREQDRGYGKHTTQRGNDAEAKHITYAWDLMRHPNREQRARTKGRNKARKDREQRHPLRTDSQIRRGLAAGPLRGNGSKELREREDAVEKDRNGRPGRHDSRVQTKDSRRGVKESKTRALAVDGRKPREEELTVQGRERNETGSARKRQRSGKGMVGETALKDARGTYKVGD